ncbi:Gfo/Idh/MocA family protein [Planctomicrobium sp. SH527]|uniref:Gfo/Idh/MocA family protein n=1 Tax=Planctomicrobium sp. SH527 TaxID=3448123 RepID=UPI003F5ADF49
MVSISRRGFLASAAAAAAISPWSRVMGANSDIRVAIIGANGIGKTHLMNFQKIPGVRVVGLCDVDSNVLGTRAAEFEKAFGGSLKKYEDLRQVFDDPGVDVVVLAVPNHWHALGTIWACQAGKDVLVEKPCSYNIWEAQQMIKAADKYERIVQVGIQRRSLDYLQEWFKELQGGALGKIQSVRGLFYSRRQPIGSVDKPVAPPAGVNIDLWSGPASTDILRKQFHYDWHWFWETGNGELGNNGPHILDLCRTAIGSNEFPSSVWSVGGRFGFEDDNGQTPNTHIINFGFKEAPVVLEIRNLPAKAGTKDNNKYRDLSVGIVVDCEGGSYVGFDKGTVYDKDGKVIKKIEGDIGADGGRQVHRENFVKALRSRKTSDLNCSVPQGHLSSSLCHMGNISHRLGEQVVLGEAIEKIQSNPIFGDAGNRLAEHLKLNDLSTDSLKIGLGAALTFDPEKQVFPESKAANELLTRNYRKPFVVPENV